MEYNVAGLLKAPHGEMRHHEVDEEPSFALIGARLTGHIVGSVGLMRTQQGVLVQADLQVEAEVTCARCLRPAHTVLAVHISEEFRPSVDIRTGMRLWPEPDEFIEDELFLDEHHVLHLDEVVRQELEASIPIKPLCRPDCAGLCPHCGADLNEEQCQCAQPIDVRWEALRQLLHN